MTPESENKTPPIRIIELAGLPGAGKSTLAACLEDMLCRAGVPTISRSVEFADHRSFMCRQQRRLQMVVRHALQCGGLFNRSFQLIARSGQISLSDFAIVTSNLWAVFALIAKAREARDRVLILDQGLIQALWSVQLSSSRALPLESWAPIFLTAGAAETLLVHIHTDLSVSRYRAAARRHGRTRLNSDNFEERSHRWHKASDNMSKLIEWAGETLPQDEHGGRVLSVANHEGTPEAAAAQIADAYLRRHVWQREATGNRNPEADQGVFRPLSRPTDPAEKEMSIILGDPAEAKRVQR
jgi:hypothetical protein